jgi:predicted glutamine amidotransferase
MSHLRHATQGEVSLRNTQPFVRELGGRMHLFAHNGHLPGIEGRLAGQWGRFRPIGSTDSEIAFCVLLERLIPLWAGSEPTLSGRLAVVAHLAEQLRELGPANFLYSDGELLFAHGHRRIQRDGSTGSPGLHLLNRECAVDRGALAAAGVLLGDPQSVALVASVPLTLEAWRPFGEGEIVVVRGGAVVATAL